MGDYCFIASSLLDVLVCIRRLNDDEDVYRGGYMLNERSTGLCANRECGCWFCPRGADGL